MNNKKVNKDLLKEELNRFNQINEFKFYEDDIEDNKAKGLILGDVIEAEDDEEPAFGDELDDAPEDAEEAPADDAEEAPEADAEVDGDAFGGDAFGDEEGGEGFGDAEAEGGFGEEPAAEEPDPMDDAVELDVTELVKGSEEAKASADAANSKITQLMDMVSKLEGQLDGMSQISQKIDNLESEIEKRNPTEDEKLICVLYLHILTI